MRTPYAIDYISVIGAAMLLLYHKTGRKVLNDKQVAAYRYAISQQMQEKNLNASVPLEITEEDILDIDYQIKDVFLIVNCKDAYQIVLSDNMDEKALKMMFKSMLPKKFASVMFSKRSLTALLMPDLLLKEEELEAAAV